MVCQVGVGGCVAWHNGWGYAGKEGESGSYPFNLLPEERPLNKYIKNEETLHCPSDKGCPSAGFSCSYDFTGSSYPYNACLCTDSSEPTLSHMTIDSVERPEAVILVGDHGIYSYLGKDPGDPDYEYDIRWHDSNRFMMNVAFVDSHVEFIEMKSGDFDPDGKWTFCPNWGTWGTCPP